MKRGNTVPLWQTGRSGFMIQEKKRAQRYLRSARSENDTRVNYDTYGIKILDVSEAGQIDFAVYGYMSRGTTRERRESRCTAMKSAGNALSRAAVSAGIEPITATCARISTSCAT